MKQINKGSIDYDYDRYGLKIRKYIVTKIIRVHGKPTAIWEEVTDFVAERKPLDATDKK